MFVTETEIKEEVSQKLQACNGVWHKICVSYFKAEKRIILAFSYHGCMDTMSLPLSMAAVLVVNAPWPRIDEHFGTKPPSQDYT